MLFESWLIERELLNGCFEGEAVEREVKPRRKERKFLQISRKDVHWFPLIEDDQVL